VVAGTDAAVRANEIDDVATYGDEAVDAVRAMTLQTCQMPLRLCTGLCHI
jgi:hypothetical protein